MRSKLLSSAWSTTDHDTSSKCSRITWTITTPTNTCQASSDGSLKTCDRCRSRRRLRCERFRLSLWASIWVLVQGIRRMQGMKISISSWMSRSEVRSPFFPQGFFHWRSSVCLLTSVLHLDIVRQRMREAGDALSDDSDLDFDDEEALIAAGINPFTRTNIRSGGGGTQGKRHYRLNGLPPAAAAGGGAGKGKGLGIGSPSLATAGAATSSTKNGAGASTTKRKRRA